MFSRRAIVLLPLSLALPSPGAMDLTGDWTLNLAKSQWGSRPKPISVTLHIQHKEPSIMYAGTVMYAGEDTRQFGFDGAIDGRSYPMIRSFASGSVVLHRIDPMTFESVFRSSDSTTVETTRTTVSTDGRVLRRRIRLTTASGTDTSVEFYERR